MEDATLQCCEHVTRADAIDTNIGVSPFDSQTANEMSHSGLRGIIWCLGLWNVHNAAAHAANAYDATGRVSAHEVLGGFHGKAVCSIDVHAPKLLHAIVWVANRIVVLCKAGRGDESVNLAVLLQHIGKSLLD